MPESKTQNELAVLVHEVQLAGEIHRVHHGQVALVGPVLHSRLHGVDVEPHPLHHGGSHHVLGLRVVQDEGEVSSSEQRVPGVGGNIKDDLLPLLPGIYDVSGEHQAGVVSLEAFNDGS